MTDATLDQIEQIARETVAAFPEPFAHAARDVAIQVAETVPDHLLDPDEDPVEARQSITGMYSGIPLTEKSEFDMPHGPDIVWLFRRPILEELAERPDETLERLVAHVTVHEFAHHFGWLDEDIAAIDRWWE